MKFNLSVLLAPVLILQGCATTIPPDNVAISHIDEQSGYRRVSESTLDSFGDMLVILSFSGGGTRAAALSYGVLQELRDTLVLFIAPIRAIQAVCGRELERSGYLQHVWFSSTHGQSQIR